uniref:Uncharacterized protein n=1 Tax=Rhizophora mucronata TaxID=61149 RepID=A0A2P2MXI2_RHIMU
MLIPTPLAKNKPKEVKLFLSSTKRLSLTRTQSY